MMRGMMKKMYFLAGKNCQKRTLAWDYYLARSGGYVEGYLQAREDAQYASNTDQPLAAIGEELVEWTAEDGKHQLNARTFAIWEKENRAMPLEAALKTYVDFFSFEEVRVVEKDGLFSFQGTARRKA